ncbi:hypothetical protein Dimus_022436 [Dionaea muscipula]
MATVEDGELQEIIGCRRSGRLSSPAIPVPSALGTSLTPDFTPIDEALESDGLQADDGDVSVELMKEPASSSWSTESIPGEDSEDFEDLMRAPSLMGGGSEDPCSVSASLLPVLEEVMNGVGAQGGYGGQVAGVSPQSPAQMLSCPLSPLLVADSLEDSSTVVRSSLVGDSVEDEEELDDSKDEVTEGWEDWLAAYPAVSAHKKANEGARSRRLVKRLSMATVEDGELREKISCRRSGRLSSPAIPVPSALGTGLTPDFTPIDEALESDGLQAEDGDVSVELMKEPASSSGGTESIPGEDSEDFEDLMRAPSLMGGVSEDPCSVSGSLLPVLEEVMNGVGARGGYGGQVAGVSPQSPAQMLSCPLSSSLVADSLEDCSTVVRSSLVGDSVEDEEELDDSKVAGQQAPVEGGRGLQ